MKRSIIARLGTLAAVAIAAIQLSAVNAPAANVPEAAKPFLLEEEPEGAADVLAVRKNAKDQQDVLVVGRIGGKKNPWIKGVVAFPIVDRSLTPCNEISGDRCPTPWDYCCSPNLSKAMVLVTVVDDAGRIVRKDARSLLQVKELDTVVVEGKAKRDKAGNVVIVASKIHVRNHRETTQ